MKTYNQFLETPFSEEVKPEPPELPQEDPAMKSKEKRQMQIKKQVLLKKMQAVRAGAGSDIVASHTPEGEMIESTKHVVDGERYLKLPKKYEKQAKKKGDFRSPLGKAKDAITDKLGKTNTDRDGVKDSSKRVFTMQNSYKPEGELVEGKKKGLDGKECWDGYKLAGTKKKGGKTVDNCVKVNEGDVHSGQGEKIQKRTKKWMDKKGQKGAPGLDAMKARTAEHKAKRGEKRHPRDQKELDKAQAFIKKNPNFGKVSEGTDKAFEYVKKQIAAKYGKSGYVSKDNPRKPQTAAEKAKVRAHQAKVDKENAAERAKDPSQGRYPKG